MDPETLLAKLRDIHTDSGVSWWPLAPLWWVIIGLLLLAALVRIIYYIRGALRRRALAELKTFSKIGSTAELAAKTMVLLKRAGLSMGRRWGTHFGKKWLADFPEMPPSMREAMLDLPYRRTDFCDAKLNRQILKFAKTWIESHV